MPSQRDERRRAAQAALPYLSRHVIGFPPAGFIAPCLPTPILRPPTGPLWVHEIKHDGYRMMAWRDGDDVRLYTRRCHDWSERYPAVGPGCEVERIEEGDVIVPARTQPLKR